MSRSIAKAAIGLSCVMMLAAMAGCAGFGRRPQPPTLTVMTYNVYVGAPPEAILATTDRAQIPLRVAEFYRTYVASKFPERAAAIAKAVKEAQPHVIGLQEISLIRKQDPADSFTNPGPNAETVESDFSKVVMEALKSEGLSYREAGRVETFDLEMPMATSSTTFVDIRLTDHDVILVRSDVTAGADAKSAKYRAELPVANLGVSVPRGYVAADVTVSGVTYHVVNTHLEHFGDPIRLAQAQELIASLSDETSPVILLGDFNTEAPDGAAYRAIVGAGYQDAWQADSDGSGYTCCQADDLKNSMSMSKEEKRIDLIFIKGVTLREGEAIRTMTVGDTADDRTPSGLWPSDHAGVVAHLPIAAE